VVSHNYLSEFFQIRTDNLRGSGIQTRHLKVWEKILKNKDMFGLLVFFFFFEKYVSVNFLNLNYTQVLYKFFNFV
jgi:hypothetical protein